MKRASPALICLRTGMMVLIILAIAHAASSGYFTDSAQEDFMNGTFNFTRWNQSGFVELNSTGGNITQNGTFISRIFNTSIINNWINISSEFSYNSGNITFQARAFNNISEESEFRGPDGTSLSYYIGQQQLNLSPSKYIQYIARLEAANASLSPMLYNASISYSPLLPNLGILSPPDNTTWNISNSIAFVYNVSSLNPVTECRLYINSSLNMTEQNVSLSSEINFTVNLSNGNYLWRIACMGHEASNATSAEMLVSVNNTAPEINNISYTLSYYSANLSVEFSEAANFTAEYGTNSSLLSGSTSNSTYRLNQTISLAGLANLTLYLINITACDEWGYCAEHQANFTTSQFPDMEPPGITQNAPFMMQNIMEGQVKFNVTVKDFSLKNISILGNWTGEWRANQSVSNSTNGTFIFNLELPNGTFKWGVMACDAYGNCENSENLSLNIGQVPLIIWRTRPQNSSLNASATQSIVLRFSSRLNQSSINISSIYLRYGLLEIPVSLSYEPGNYSVYATPLLPLMHGFQYTLHITEEIRSLGNLTLAANQSLTFTISSKDLDNDGTPDINDTDDDGDGIGNSLDSVKGNASSVFSNRLLSVRINSSGNLSYQWNGTYTVSINDSEGKLIEFSRTISPSNKLDLSNISVIKDQEKGRGSLLIAGIELPGASTKVLYINNTDGNASDICLRDTSSRSIEDISQGCSSQDEFFLRCDGAERGGYTCSQESGRLRVTGSLHTAAEERCAESWSCSSWVPFACYVGVSQHRNCIDLNGCGTERYKPATQQLCENIIASSRRGCRAEWECGDWSGCFFGFRTRECVNVGQCPDHVKTPIMKEACGENASAEEKEKRSAEGVPGPGAEDTAEDSQSTVPATGKESPAPDAKEAASEPGLEEPSGIFQWAEKNTRYLAAIVFILGAAGLFYAMRYGYNPVVKAVFGPARANIERDIFDYRKFKEELEKKYHIEEESPHPGRGRSLYNDLIRDIKLKKDASKWEQYKKDLSEEFGQLGLMLNALREKKFDLDSWHRKEHKRHADILPPKPPAVYSEGKLRKWAFLLKNRLMRSSDESPRAKKEAAAKNQQEIMERKKDPLVRELDRTIESLNQEKELELGKLSAKPGLKDRLIFLINPSARSRSASLHEKIRSSESIHDEIKKEFEMLARSIQEAHGEEKEGFSGGAYNPPMRKEGEKEPGAGESSIMGGLNQLKRSVGLDEKKKDDSLRRLGSKISSFFPVSRERREKLKGISSFNRERKEQRNYSRGLKELIDERIVDDFVAEKGGQWSHDEFMDIMGKVRAKGYDVGEAELGALLETKRGRIRKRE